MTNSSTQSIAVNASIAEVARVITDFAAYPEWVSAVKTVEVLEEYEDGYASQVSFVIDAGVVKDDYVLAYDYTEDLSRVEWQLVRSNAQKSQQGSYDLVEDPGGITTVTYTLAVDLNIPVLGILRRKAEKVIMDTALRELKKRVEA
jgi:uncharacterized membrane protein